MGDIGFGDSLDMLPDAGATEPAGATGMPSNAPAGGFGSGLFGRNAEMFNNRPQADSDNPVADRIHALQAGRQRLQRSIDNPLRAFLKPDAYKRDIEQAAKFDQELFASQQAIQQQRDLRETAANAGMDAARVATLGATATQQTVLNAWTQDYSGGSFNAARALSGMGDVGKGILAQHEGDFMPALMQRNDQAQEVIDRLNNAAASGQTAYTAQLNQLRQQGIDPSKVLSNYIPGFVVPDKADAWQVRGKGAQGTLAQAKQMTSQYATRQAQLGLSEPVSDDKEAGAVQSTLFKGSTGNAIEGGNTVKLPTGEYGSSLPAGSRVLQDYGTKWNNATPQNIKEFNTQLGDEQTKGVIGQYKMAKNFYELTQDKTKYTSAAGLALISDELGGLGRDLAEGSKAAGSIGLSKMLDAKYGTVGNFLNKATTNWSEFAAWMDAGKKGTPPVLKPRLTPDAITGIQDIAQFKRDQSLNDVKERIGQPLFTAGRYGIDLSKTGLDKTLQSDDAVKGSYTQGRQSYLTDVASHPAVFEGDTRIMLRQATTNPQAQRTPLVRDADKQPQPLIPSPGHESPPAGGAVHAAQGGETKATANAQLGFANHPQQLGLASDITPPDPDAKTQGKITPNAATFLLMTRGSEANGTNPNSYNLINGGQRFTQYDDHPRVMVGKSSAAGAYQFTATTWDETAAKYGPLLDRNSKGHVVFTPQNQDKAAWLLAQDRYATKTGGNLEKDMNDPRNYGKIFGALNGTWTSLPGGKEPNNATGSRLQAMAGYARQFASRYGSTVAGMLPGPVGNAAVVYNALPETVQNAVKATAVEHAPEIGSTVGAIAGGGAGGLVGGVAGGAAGGAAGQAFKNYMQGNDISASIGREAALGAVGGIVPANPLVGAAARVVGAGAVSAGAKALEDDAAPSDIFAAGRNAAAGALLGEAGLGAVGLALGKAGHMIFSKFTTSTQQELAKAGEVIAKGKPDAPKPSAPGQPVSATAKAEHDAATVAYDSAVQSAKDHGIDPDHLGYAVQQVPAGAARTMAPALREKAAIGKGYDEIRQDVAATGVGTPKQAPLVNGPLSLVGKHPDVPQEYMGRATQAENNITAPAKDWSEKYQQLFDERSKLLTEERAALNGATTDPNKARALRTIAENVRTQQEAAATYIFGPQRGARVIAKLQSLDKRYATLMDATHGGDIVANMAKPGAEGLAARKAFASYAADDPGAQQMANALLSDKVRPHAGGSNIPKYIVAGIAGMMGVPHTVATIVAMEGPKLLNDWALRRAAGAPITIKQLLAQRGGQVSTYMQQQARAAAGRVGAEAMQ